MLPLFHVAGLGLMLTTQQAGGANVVASKFDPAQAVRVIAAEKVTVMSEFAPMLEIRWSRLSPANWRHCAWSPGSIRRRPSSASRRPAPMPHSGRRSANRRPLGLATLSPYRDRPRSAGRPLFWRTVAVVDSADIPGPTGQTGEIVVRGPTVFKGYWNNEADTAFTFRNGWHHTGDMGYFDADGYLWYAGRAPEKELIKTGGENVYPAEVERAIDSIPRSPTRS